MIYDIDRNHPNAKKPVPEKYLPRPDSFAEWLSNLEVGEEVKLTRIWKDDGTFRGWVKRKTNYTVTVQWMAFDDPEHGIVEMNANMALPSGGNTEIRIHHMNREAEYHPSLGYEFKDRIEYFLSNGMTGNPL